MTLKTRAALGAFVALAVLTVAACSSSPAPVAAPTTIAPTPTPTPTHLDERAACALLLPAVTDAVNIMDDFRQHPDLSTVDRRQLDATIATVNRVQEDGPPDLDQKLAQLLTPLKQLQAASASNQETIDLFTFSLVARGINDQCRPYA